jgi:hypothetical protein
MGDSTRENYANIIRRDTVQDYFKKFTFISSEEVKMELNPKVKFVNPHSSLISTSTDDSRTKTNEKQNTIENKLSKYKSITNTASSLVFKGLKKSNSTINYNYMKNKTGQGSPFQN